MLPLVFEPPDLARGGPGAGRLDLPMKGKNLWHASGWRCRVLAELGHSMGENRPVPERLRAALTALVERHASLVNSGDCGFWDVETEASMIQARAALGGHQQIRKTNDELP